MNLKDRELLAKTLQAEAGNQGYNGMVAVGSVIMNRLGGGSDLGKVILQPGHFSAWNRETDYLKGEQGQDMSFTPSDKAYEVADALLSGNYEDPTGGATHYYNPQYADPIWGASAGDDWLTIGAHVFGKANKAGSNSIPNGALAMDNKVKNQPSVLGVQTQPPPPPQPRQGLLGGQGIGSALGMSEDFRDKLKVAILSGSDPRGFAGQISSIQEGMQGRKAEAKASDRRNKTAAVLRQRGQGKIADLLEQGLISGSDAGQYLMAVPKTYEFQALTAELMKADPSLSKAEALNMAISKNKSNITLNAGDIGDPNYVYGAKAGLPAGWRIDKRTGEASVIPGGPEAADSAASAKAEVVRKRDTYEKDLTFFATGDKILNAINEKTLIPATGTAAAMWSAVPWLGQFQKDVQEDFAQLQAQMQMDALQNLRETSQNGSSGLGQLTDAERTAIGKVKNNLTNLKSEDAAATSVRSAMLLKAYFEGGLFDPSINGYRVASESELSSMVNGVNPFGNSEGPQITSGFNQFLPKYVAPQETAPIGLTQQQLMEKYN